MNDNLAGKAYLVGLGLGATIGATFTILIKAMRKQTEYDKGFKDGVTALDMQYRRLLGKMYGIKEQDLPTQVGKVIPFRKKESE